MVTHFKDDRARHEPAEAASREWRLAPRRAFNEMAARRSFKRSMGKFEPQVVDKPIAIMTAWRKVLLDPSTGQPYPEAIRRRLNDEANEMLKANIRRRGLSFYPVVGAGQERDEHGNVRANKENSLVVQPMGKMDNDAVRDHIRELLFNPTGEHGKGPFSRTLDSAVVKFPGDPQAYLLGFPSAMRAPTGPQDYTEEDPIGDSAERRLHQEPNYTQMRYGSRATPAMMDQLDRADDVGNPRPGTGKPGAGLPGQRFVIQNGGQP